jgi:GT2 family glycosyltransferase
MDRRAGRLNPAVSVIVCAYTERRWDRLVWTVAAVSEQLRTADELLVVVDHNARLLARAREAFPSARVLASDGTRGLSGARNTGVRHARGQLLAFVDDDAVPQPQWLDHLLQAFAADEVIGAGGSALPVWSSAAPKWMPPEFLWVVGASYEGLPHERAAVRNPIGANMAFRREAFERVGGFREGIGRVGATPLGCEETEFAIRARRSLPGSVVMYVPDARVEHHVDSERATWRYFTARCWAEGRSKALVTAIVGAGDGLASERSYVARTLPRGFLAGLSAAVRGDVHGLARSFAIVLGVAASHSDSRRCRCMPDAPVPRTWRRDSGPRCRKCCLRAPTEASPIWDPAPSCADCSAPRAPGRRRCPRSRPRM